MLVLTPSGVKVGDHRVINCCEEDRERKLITGVTGRAIETIGFPTRGNTIKRGEMRLRDPQPSRKCMVGAR